MLNEAILGRTGCSEYMRSIAMGVEESAQWPRILTAVDIGHLKIPPVRSLCRPPSVGVSPCKLLPPKLHDD